MSTSTLPITVERYQGDLSNQDHATAQTVGLMAKQIRQCAQDPAVQAAARNALLKYSQGRTGAYAACWAAWWSIRHTLKFMSDDSLLRNIPTPNPPELELLVSPSVMVRARSPQGDCDDFTMLMCCFLQVLGVPWEIVTVAADLGDAQRWSHVYAVAILENGGRLPMDAAPPDAKWPGWEVPADHILRYQAWDQDGQPVDRLRPIKRMQGYRRRGMRGLGQVCLAVDPDSGVCTSYGTSGSSSVSYADLEQQLASDTPTGQLNPVTAPSSFQTELNTLLNSWTQIGSRVIAPTTTYTSGGTTITTPAGSTAASSLLASIGGGISTGTMLLLAGAAVLLMVFASKR
jgi:hypothetical protein